MKKIYKTNSLSLTKIALVSISFFIASAISDAANATVKKCVPLVDGNQTTCTSDPTLYDSHIDWAAECTTNGVTSEIKGIAACSNQQPYSCGTRPGCDWTYADRTMRQQTITTSNDVNQNKYCWCKMTTPAVSLWVFGFGDDGAAGPCARGCAMHCTNDIKQQYFNGFRSALFSGMGE